MCFTEYLAYTCGHTSVAVNRPCPMTTNLYNNPCCSNPACRPFLVETVCHPCARILHSRGVNIAEYEHRFMHERGACQCEVQFPALLHPRLIHRSSIDSSANTSSSGSGSGQSENNTDTTSSGTLSYDYTASDPSSHHDHQHSHHHHQHGQQDHPAASGSFNAGKGKGKYKHRKGKGKGRGGKGKANANAVQQYHLYMAPAPIPIQIIGEEGAGEMPLFEERRVGDEVQVAVRLSSMYAAEWTKDHAKLHRSGKCKCPVSFEPYKPLNTEAIESYPNSPAEVEAAGQNISPESMTVAPAQQAQVQEEGSGNCATSIARSSTTASGCDYTYNARTNNSYAQTGQRPNSGGSTSAATAHHDAYGNQTQYNNYNHHHHHHHHHQQMQIPPVGAIARQPFTQAQMSPLDELLGVVGPGLVPCQSKNNNSNNDDNDDDDGDGDADCSRRPVDVQTVHYSLPKDNVPIVGNPIDVSVSAAGNTATANENEMQLPTIVEYPQPKEVIAGFPLGAGPEGQSHAGDFEDCALNLRKRRRVSNEF